MFQMEIQDKHSEKELNTMKISNLANKEFKSMVIKMFTELRRRMDGHSENLKRKYKKAPIRAEKYNNKNEKYTVGNKQKIY